MGEVVDIHALRARRLEDRYDAVLNQLLDVAIHADPSLSTNVGGLALAEATVVFLQGKDLTRDEVLEVVGKAYDRWRAYQEGVDEAAVPRGT